MDGYFGWLAQKGYELPERRNDVWLPEGEDAVPGATNLPARLPAGLTDSAFFTERALTYPKGKGEKPWFLHLGHYRPHPPFVAAAPYHAMYRPEDMPAPIPAESPEAEGAQHPMLGYYLEKIRQASFFERAEGYAASMDAAEIQQMRATYAGMISEVNDCLGQVFAHLDATGQWEDTLIIFTSDHGEQLGDHHLLGKLGYYDESLLFLVLALAVLAFLGNSLTIFIILLGFHAWERYARIARGLAISARAQGYAGAVWQLGASPWRIYGRHVLPNIASTPIVSMTLAFPEVILLESGLSFLGLGVQPPSTSLGNMVGYGREYLTGAPWILLAPAFVIVCTTLAVSLVGDRPDPTLS